MSNFIASMIYSKLPEAAKIRIRDHKSAQRWIMKYLSLIIEGYLD